MELWEYTDDEAGCPGVDGEKFNMEWARLFSFNMCGTVWVGLPKEKRTFGLDGQPGSTSMMDISAW
jgi:hypothetical protein